MPGRDGVDSVMTGVADSHRQSELVWTDLAGTHAGLRRDHVVKRCHSVTSPGRQEYAEVLGVSVGGSQQPEHDHGLHQCALILGGVISISEQAENLFNSGASITLILEGRRYGECLTTILLRQAEKPPLPRPQAAKTVHD